MIHEMFNLDQKVEPATSAKRCAIIPPDAAQDIPVSRPFSYLRGDTPSGPNKVRQEVDQNSPHLSATVQFNLPPAFDKPKNKYCVYVLQQKGNKSCQSCHTKAKHDEHKKKKSTGGAQKGARKTSSRDGINLANRNSIAPTLPSERELKSSANGASEHGCRAVQCEMVQIQSDRRAQCGNEQRSVQQNDRSQSVDQQPNLRRRVSYSVEIDSGLDSEWSDQSCYSNKLVSRSSSQLLTNLQPIFFTPSSAEHSGRREESSSPRLTQIFDNFLLRRNSAGMSPESGLRSGEDGLRKLSVSTGTMYDTIHFEMFHNQIRQIELQNRSGEVQSPSIDKKEKDIMSKYQCGCHKVSTDLMAKQNLSLHSDRMDADGYMIPIVTASPRNNTCKRIPSAVVNMPGRPTVSDYAMSSSDSSQVVVVNTNTFVGTYRCCTCSRKVLCAVALTASCGLLIGSAAGFVVGWFLNRSVG